MRAEAPKRKPHIQNQINYFKSWGSLYLAEREGFEPSIRYKRIHTFQACAFSHSAISPNFVSRRFQRRKPLSARIVGKAARLIKNLLENIQQVLIKRALIARLSLLTRLRS